jgi:hypothetical protein
MDTILSSFLSWQLLLFALGIFFIVWVVRTVVGYFWKGAEDNALWTELVLRLMPIAAGILIGKFATGYPYPTGLSSESGRLIFGIVGGGLSGTVFSAFKGLLKGYVAGLSPTTTVSVQNATTSGATTTTTTATTVVPATTVVSAANSDIQFPQPPSNG